MDCSGFPNRLLNFYDFQLFVISGWRFWKSFYSTERALFLAQYITAELKLENCLFTMKMSMNSPWLKIVLISTTFPGLEITFFQIPLYLHVFHDCPHWWIIQPHKIWSAGMNFCITQEMNVSKDLFHSRKIGWHSARVTEHP